MRFTGRTVEIFVIGKRIAAHVRGSGNHRQTTTSTGTVNCPALPVGDSGCSAKLQQSDRPSRVGRRVEAWDGGQTLPRQVSV